MNARETTEAKIYKALDNLEAVIQHNEADISTWLPLEYDLQMTYGVDKASFSPYLSALREMVRQDSIEKIKKREEIKSTRRSERILGGRVLAFLGDKIRNTGTFSAFPAGTAGTPGRSRFLQRSWTTRCRPHA